MPTSRYADRERLAAEGREKYRGTARIRLEVLHFPQNETRELDQQKVESLKKSFAKGQCDRVGRNHITAVISSSQLSEVLRDSKVSAKTLLSNADPHSQLIPTPLPPRATRDTQDFKPCMIHEAGLVDCNPYYPCPHAILISLTLPLLCYSLTRLRDQRIKLLIAIGNTGRDNIESLEIAWQSRSDYERQWAEAPIPHEYSLTLPTIHVSTCTQLLKQCKRLRFLRLYFESDIIQSMSTDMYKADPGIRGLCSIHGIKSVEICDLGYEPLGRLDFVKWLKEAMEESPERTDVTETGDGEQHCGE